MNVYRAFILLLVVLLAAMRPVETFAGGHGVLRFKETAEVLTRTYALGDIVTLKGFSSQQKKRLGWMEIGQTPRPGQWTQVTRTEVAAVLENRLPGLTRTLQWSGPAFIRIHGGGVRCDMRALKQSAHAFLTDRLREQYDQVTVRLVDEPEPVITAAGRVTFHPRVSPARRLRKRMPVWVDIFVEGRHFQTVPLWFDVSVPMRVWVVQKDLKPKDPMTPDSAALILQDVAGVSGEPVTAASLEGLRSVGKLAEGSVLTTGDVEPIPAVSRGDLITVYACQGAVRLQVKAVALADGLVSQRIDVQNPCSGESFQATVIGAKQAKVN